MKSNFYFLNEEYPELARLSELAENLLYLDPSATLIKLRTVSEKVTLVIGEYEGFNDLKHKDQISRVNALQDSSVLPREMVEILHKIRKSGNKATHEGIGSEAQARFMLRQMFFFLSWFYELYENEEVVVDFVAPEPKEDQKEIISDLEEQLKTVKQQVTNYKSKVELLSKSTEQEKETRKKRSEKIIRKTEENEAQTRERIDAQLRDNGWLCDTEKLNYKTKRTLPEKGKNMAIAEWSCGNLWADYALFIGEDLVGVVEAKKHKKSVANDLVQAKKYSKQPSLLGNAKLVSHANSSNYKVPFLFATNGRPYLEQFKEASGIWFWDATNQTNVQKPLQDWFTPYDLQEKLKFDKKKGTENLKTSSYDILSDKSGLNLRYYQIDAIKAVEKKIIEHPQEEKALIAMATGTGKTRTIVGLAYRLIAAKRFKRILFLVDRTMLGTQASDTFKEVKIESLQTFAQIYDLQELDTKIPELDTKIHFATVQSMVARIQHDTDAPTVGDYDCIIVDEAHRGYTLDREMDMQELFLYNQQDFQSKYRMVLDYFDAYRIGLTATPATHTVDIFGNPTYHYSYRKAVVDGFLVDFEPPYVFKTKLSEEGIVWEKGDEVKIYDPESTRIVSLGITEDEIDVKIQGFNKRVITDSFNRTVLREIIEEYGLDPEDQKKTLIFAATTDHADTIVKILKELYKDIGEDVDDDAIVKLVGDTYDRETLLRNYKNEQYPSIVVTVDLLTTGIDVPSITNLIFLRRVNSRILYDQMIGRATRRNDEIGKEIFKIYDCVGVTEMMANTNVMKPVAPSPTKSFVDIGNEIKLIEDEIEMSIKLDRVIAKLRGKIRTLSPDQLERTNYLSGENDLDSFILKLRSLSMDDLKDEVDNQNPLWQYLDKEKGKRQGFGTLFSEHQDEVREVTRAYGENLKPKDYIESFVEYIKANINEIEALKIIATKPRSLDRKSLKEIKFILDENGFTKRGLNTAYSDANMLNTTADIISHIRTAAIGIDLIDHETRINNAVNKLRASHKWNAIQNRWIDRIEKQLLKESIIQVEDLNKPPFSDKGGVRTLNKIFKDKTKQIIEELNSYLYA